MNFARNFVILRKKMGLSQEQMAEKCGVSRAALAKWETGDTIPNLYLVCDIAKIFQVSLDELVHGCIDYSSDVLEMVNDKLDEILKEVKSKNSNMGIYERYSNENDNKVDEGQKDNASEMLYNKGLVAKEKGKYTEAIDYLEDALVCGNSNAFDLLIDIQNEIVNEFLGEVSETQYWSIVSDFVKKREQYEKIATDIRKNK